MADLARGASGLPRVRVRRSTRHPVLLVVAAHPDDEVLGCGATVAMRSRQGWGCHLLVLATGVTGRLPADGKHRQSARARLARIREDLHQSARILGFDQVCALDFPDNRLDTVSRMDLAQAVDTVVEIIRPDVVLTHHPGDYNWDHEHTFDAVMMAARSSPGEYAPREILTFETLSATERAAPICGRAFLPNSYVGVNRIDMGFKKQALACYRDERRRDPHPRSTQGIETLARKRGQEIGIHYAEAFWLARRVDGRRSPR